MSEENHLSNPGVLIVDRNPVNIKLFGDLLKKHAMTCYGATDYETFDAILDSKYEFVLVLIDLAGFDEAIWERCRTIHKKSIPLLIMSGRSDAGFQANMVQSGASGFLQKPININSLLKLINSLVNHESPGPNTPGAGTKQ